MPWWVGRGAPAPVAASGEKEKIVGGSSTCVFRHGTAMQERAGCRRTTLALSPSCHWPRARGAFCVTGVVMADGKVVLPRVEVVLNSDHRRLKSSQDAWSALV